LAQPQGESVSLPCCGYTNPEAIKWNQFNGVVQCHNCGQVYNTTPPSVEAAIETKTTQHGGEYPIYTQQDMDDAIAETLEKAAKVCEERSDEMKRRAEGELLTNLGKTVALEKAKTLDMCAAAIRSMK
jgi:transcription elongation factor Elf1